MGHSDDAEETRFVQIRQEVSDVNVSQDLQEMHLNSARVSFFVLIITSLL